MTDSRTAARVVEHQLRLQAAGVATELSGRLQSAARLDELFHAFVRLCRPDLFLEVGAFEASASRRVRRALPQCRAVALEASPVNHRHHDGRTDFAALGVEYLNRAVCRHSGTVRLPVAVDPRSGDPELTGNTSLLGSPLAEAVVELEVPATTLDDLSAACDGAVALWIDVEGAVGPVLGGASATLPKVDLVKVEVEDAATWPGQEMVAADVIESLLAAGLCPVARDSEYAGQYNIVFLSDRAMRVAGVLERLEQYLREEANDHSREPGRLRRSPALRSMLRPVRRRFSTLRQ